MRIVHRVPNATSKRLSVWRTKFPKVVLPFSLSTSKSAFTLEDHLPLPPPMKMLLALLPSSQTIRPSSHRSHQRYHIAHGIFWENEAGESPDPFTTIYSQNITDGVWKPRDSSLNEYVLAYTQSLEANGKFSLTIWPEHCIIGSPGHNIVPDVLASALEWTKGSLKPIQYVMKRSNPFMEHYSALRAEYELPYDPSTSLNTALIKSLQRANKLVIVGEALSHCVNFTVRDLVDNWPAERLSDLILLTDCSSPVAGFEAEAEQFLTDMAAKGLTLTTSTEFYA